MTVRSHPHIPDRHTHNILLVLLQPMEAFFYTIRLFALINIYLFNSLRYPRVVVTLSVSIKLSGPSRLSLERSNLLPPLVICMHCSAIIQDTCWLLFRRALSLVHVSDQLFTWNEPDPSSLCTFVVWESVRVCVSLYLTVCPQVLSDINSNVFFSLSLYLPHATLCFLFFAVH